jgi:hypothetical protein
VVIVEAVAVRFQVLPEVIDLSLIPTGCGVGAMIAALAGAFARLEPDRLARVVLLGNLGGGVSTTVFLLLGIAGVLS